MSRRLKVEMKSKLVDGLLRPSIVAKVRADYNNKKSVVEEEEEEEDEEDDAPMITEFSGWGDGLGAVTGTTEETRDLVPFGASNLAVLNASKEYLDAFEAGKDPSEVVARALGVKSLKELNPQQRAYGEKVRKKLEENARRMRGDGPEGGGAAASPEVMEATRLYKMVGAWTGVGRGVGCGVWGMGVGGVRGAGCTHSMGPRSCAHTRNTPPCLLVCVLLSFHSWCLMLFCEVTLWLCSTLLHGDKGVQQGHVWRLCQVDAGGAERDRARYVSRRQGLKKLPYQHNSRS